MVDDRPETIGPSPDQGRARREPPTIDLDASEVSSETRTASGDPKPEHATAETQDPKPEPPPAEHSVPDEPPAPVSSWVVAPLSGAVAASLVIGLAWILGWPEPAARPNAPAPPPVDTAAINDLAARVASVESKTSKPPAPTPDPAAAARIDALEKSLTSLRGELAAARTQSEKLAAALNDAKATPRDDSTPRENPAPVDLTEINARIAQIEQATKAQGAAIAQESARAAALKAAEAKPADDVPLRRVVAAALLDVLVRSGDSYPAALATAKSLAPNADTLKPLEEFAAKGVPNAATLSRELLTLVPKLSPVAPADNATTGSGIVERLQAGAAKLVRIERTDTVGNDRGALVARVTAAALRNDYAEARRELNTLAPSDRTAAQSWLDRADARDAALAASRQFATDAMAALGKPAQ